MLITNHIINFYHDSHLDDYYEKTKTWVAANRAFSELAASFVFNVTLIAFTTTPLYMPALYLAISHLAVGALFYIAMKVYKYFFEYKKETEPCQQIARASSAYMLGSSGPQIAIHESGHALMALSCFQKADPWISIFPFRGGMTSYVVSRGMTTFGRYLGKENALLLIASAGPMATTLFAMLAFALANNIEETHPIIAQFLTYQGAAHLLSEVMYGLSAFYASKHDLTHDFIYLWKLGNIHPLIPVSLMIALPIAEVALLRFCKD